MTPPERSSLSACSPPPAPPASPSRPRSSIWASRRCSVSRGKRGVFGLAVGGVLGYLAALFIAHERLAFLAEYAPLVTLMAVIGAYLGADNLQASGFMAVFTFGTVLGHKDA